MSLRKHWHLLAYDIRCPRRLRRVQKRVARSGQGLQQSVYLVRANPRDLGRLLAEHNVPATLLPGRGRGEPVWMGAGLSASVAPRQAQYAVATRPHHRLVVAREQVQAKLAACRDVLVWREDEDAALIEQLHRQREALAHCEDMASLLGVEGTAARHWFAGLQARIPEHWGFQGRNRRPPRDPVNALLSLGYTLLATLAQGRVEATGLDPWRGFLHEPVAGRPALALDVMEAFRPWIDLFVLTLLDTVLGPEDFTSTESDGCRLNKAARGRFYAAWATWSRSLPGPSDGDGEREPGLAAALGRHARALRQRLEAMEAAIGGAPF